MSYVQYLLPAERLITKPLQLQMVYTRIMLIIFAPKTLLEQDLHGWLNKMHQVHLLPESICLRYIPMPNAIKRHYRYMKK